MNTETRLNERMRRHHKRLGSIGDHLATSARGTVASRVEAVEAETAEEAEAIRRYHAIGAARAKQLGNRGPLRLDADGRVAQDIIESYYQHGFYVLEGVVKGEELVDLRDEFERLLDNAPAGSDDKPWRPPGRLTGPGWLGSGSLPRPHWPKRHETGRETMTCQ